MVIFIDLKEERLLLRQSILPTLQSFCSEHNLDVQLVDMVADSAEDAIYDPNFQNLCLQEMKRCQRLSLGACFLVRQIH